MKYIACILLSLALAAFGPVSENGAPVDNMRQIGGPAAANTPHESDTSYSQADSTEMLQEGNNCCTDVASCSAETCNSDKCAANAVTAMPAVGLYAPLLDPQKARMSLAKIKAKKKALAAKKKAASAATKTLKP